MYHASIAFISLYNKHCPIITKRVKIILDLLKLYITSEILNLILDELNNIIYMRNLQKHSIYI